MGRELPAKVLPTILRALRIRKRQEDQGFFGSRALRCGPRTATLVNGSDDCLGGRLCLLRRSAQGFFVNLLKTGDFEKHYMLSSLRLMRSICCDNVPLDLRTAIGSPALPPLASERMLLQGFAGQRGGERPRLVPVEREKKKRDECTRRGNHDQKHTQAAIDRYRRNRA